jgi:hypothetical protein
VHPLSGGIFEKQSATWEAAGNVRVAVIVHKVMLELSFCSEFFSA